MKTKPLLSLLVLLIISINVFCQVSFSGQNIIISGALNIDSPQSVRATDIDGDGDQDVLSASSGDDTIAWYENTDGNGTFGTQRIITTLTDGPVSVYATDIDGDGDQDVLSASLFDDRIAWYENSDGNGTFGTQQTITTLADRAASVFAADIDGDGDQDVLSASADDDKVAWYENTDGNGTFGTQQIISSSVNHATTVYATDIDGDGDQDVLSASVFSDYIVLFVNTDGNGTFGGQYTITTLTNSPQSVYAIDVDGDGDQDVLSASYQDDKIAWYENTDGNGIFGPQQIITNFANGANRVYASDIDGDGDQDVLSTDQSGFVVWYENTDGNGVFGAFQFITWFSCGANSADTADFDGDGDLDVLSASSCENIITWQENLRPLGIPEDKLAEFSVYPNPTTNFITIRSENNITKVEICNQLGQIIFSKSHENEIDISSLQNGIYFVKITDGYGYLGNKKILKY